MHIGIKDIVVHVMIKMGIKIHRHLSGVGLIILGHVLVIGVHIYIGSVSRNVPHVMVVAILLITVQLVKLTIIYGRVLLDVEAIVLLMLCLPVGMGSTQ